MADLIQLRGLRTVGVHGILDFEKQNAQPFEVDLDIELDLHSAGLSDDVADTLDYGIAARHVCELVAHEQHNLLERVAQRITEEILFDKRVVAVDVTVKKLRPPVPVDLATAAVRIRRP